MDSPHVLPSLSPQCMAAHSEGTLGAAVAPAGDTVVAVATVGVAAVLVATGRRGRDSVEEGQEEEEEDRLGALPGGGDACLFNITLGFVVRFRLLARGLLLPFLLLPIWILLFLLTLLKLAFRHVTRYFGDDLTVLWMRLH